jgi:putative tryptophan/tyrosine transport system substrate-binding protein
MRRRDLLAIVPGGLALSRTAFAQRSGVPVIGFLALSEETVRPVLLPAFHKGLGEAGFVEGRNVAVDYAFADGLYDRLPALAGEFVRRKVDVIVPAGGTVAALVTRAATREIPIVGLAGDDPVRIGLADSINRPGGNFTGVVQLVVDAGGKRLELMRELLPDSRVIGFLNNPSRPYAAIRNEEMRVAAKALGLDVTVLDADDDDALRQAMADARAKAGALVIAGDPYFLARQRLIAALAEQHALPTMYFFRDFVVSGGLISYGSNLANAFYQVGVYVGRILRGAKPADLPMVQQSDKLELVLNLRAARSIGLTVPNTILLQADEIIE